MASPKITKPTSKVKGLKVTRSGWKFKAEWTVPSAATAAPKSGAKKDYRWSNIGYEWIVSYTDSKKKKKTVGVKLLAGRTAKSVTFDLSAFFRKALNKSISSATVNSVTVKVYGKNAAGSGPSSSETYDIKKPDEPKVSWAYNPSTGIATVTVKSDAGTGKEHRDYTGVRVELKQANGKIKSVMNLVKTTSTEFKKSFDIGNYPCNFANLETLTFTAYAQAHGMQGSSKSVKASRTIAYPRAANITSITTTSKANTGKIRVKFDVGSYTDTVQLERRHGEEGSWQAVEGAVDNGVVKDLYDNVGQAELVRGEYVYYQIVSQRDGYTTTSNAKRADALFTPLPSGTGTVCEFYEDPIAGDDGTSAILKIGWNGNRTRTEVTWSEDRNAWKSNKEPDKYEADWKDSTSKAQGWASTMEMHLQGLDEDKAYYIRARTLYEAADGTITYGPYSEMKQVEPAVRPNSVVLSAPPYIAYGESIPVSWVFDGEGEQKTWAIHPVGNANKSYASGEDALGTASIPPSAYGNATTISFYVSVSTGGKETNSAPVTVGISQYPVCRVAVPDTATAQPVGFEVYSDQDTCDVVASVYSRGITKPEPDRDRDQYDGDVVWTSLVHPNWEEIQWSSTLYYSHMQAVVSDAFDDMEEADTAASALQPGDEGYQEAQEAFESATAAYQDAEAELNSLVGSTYACTISVPTGTDFIDTGRYVVRVQLANSTTLLQSNVMEAGFDVLWDHQAPAPPDEIEVSVDTAGRTADIALAPPQGAELTDVYDVYRRTLTGLYLIRSGAALDEVVHDPYPAFGEWEYRVCTRTADGDFDWADYEYELPVEETRIDYGGESLELGWGLAFSGEWAKQFEEHLHDDGSISGHWDKAVMHHGTVSTSLIKGRDDDTRAALLKVAEYPAPCFVRTKDGLAFQCNVQVNETHRQHSEIIGEELSFSEVGLTREFMADVPEEE